jgi:hypothetical protein
MNRSISMLIIWIIVISQMEWWTIVGMQADQCLSLSSSRLKLRLIQTWVISVATTIIRALPQSTPNESWDGMTTSRVNREKMTQKRSVTSPMHKEEQGRIINPRLRLYWKDRAQKSKKAQFTNSAIRCNPVFSTSPRERSVQIWIIQN